MPGHGGRGSDGTGQDARHPYWVCSCVMGVHLKGGDSLLALFMSACPDASLHALGPDEGEARTLYPVRIRSVPPGQQVI